MKQKNIMLLASIGLIIILAASTLFIACAPEAAPGPGPARTVTVTVTAPAPTAAPKDVITWRMWQPYQATTSDEQEVRWWTPPWAWKQLAARVLSDTDGRLDIHVGPPGELGFKGPEILRALDGELVELAAIVGGYVSAELPWIGILDLPFVLKEPYSGGTAMAAAVKPYMDELGADYNFKCLYYGRLHPAKYISTYTKDPVSTPDDLKGLKIRVYSPYQVGTLEGCGAIATFMPGSEVPTAIKTGIIDATVTSIGLGTQLGYIDLGMVHETAMWVFPGMTPFTVSTKALEKLPPDVKEIFLEAVKWYADNNDAHQTSELIFQETLQRDRDNGVTIVDHEQPGFTDKLEEFTRNVGWPEYEKAAAPIGAEILRKVLEAQGRSR